MTKESLIEHLERLYDIIIIIIDSNSFNHYYNYNLSIIENYKFKKSNHDKHIIYVFEKYESYDNFDLNNVESNYRIYYKKIPANGSIEEMYFTMNNLNVDYLIQDSIEVNNVVNRLLKIYSKDEDEDDDEDVYYKELSKMMNTESLLLKSLGAKISESDIICFISNGFSYFNIKRDKKDFYITRIEKSKDNSDEEESNEEALTPKPKEVELDDKTKETDSTNKRKSPYKFRTRDNKKIKN